MPFIYRKTDQAEVSPVVVLAAVSTLSANAGSTQGLSANLVSETPVTARLGGGISADLVSETPVFARGRIGDEPNVFGTATLISETTLEADPVSGIGGLAVLASETSLSAVGFIRQPTQSVLRLLVDVEASQADIKNNVISARISADGVDYPISSFGYSESRGDAGASVAVTLTKSSDKAAIESATNIKFEVYKNGVWSELFSTGERAQTGFSVASTGDQLTLSTAATIAERLERSPDNNLTIYDNLRLSLDSTDFESIFDTDGIEYSHDLTKEPGLTLFRLLEIVATQKMGFASYQTNLPDHALRRADFSITQSYLDGIAGHIGVFQPLIFVQGDTLWIIDGTADFPAGFPAPKTISADQIINAQLGTTNRRIDGYVLQFSQDESDFDYIQTRTETLTPETIGNFGDADYSKTTTKQTFDDYFKSSQPFTAVRTVKTKEESTTERQVDGITRTVGEETEVLDYDSLGRLIKITKTSKALIPGVDGMNSLETVRTEEQTLTYKVDVTNPRRQMLTQVIKRASGLVAVDEENLQLGKVFKQDYSRAFEAGNITESMLLEFQTIETIEEKFRRARNGEIEGRRRRINLLTDPPTVTEGGTDVRPGDLSVNSQTSESKEVIVKKSAVISPSARFVPIAVAELPIDQAVPVAKRLLAKSNLTTGQVTLVGFDLTLNRGS